MTEARLGEHWGIAQVLRKRSPPCAIASMLGVFGGVSPPYPNTFIWSMPTSSMMKNRMLGCLSDRFGFFGCSDLSGLAAGTAFAGAVIPAVSSRATASAIQPRFDSRFCQRFITRLLEQPAV